MVPGYLSLVTGLSVGEVRDARPGDLPRIAVNTLLFMAGFGFVFIGLFLGTTALSSALLDNQRVLQEISGGLVMLMALYLAGSQLLMLPSLYPEARFHPHLQRLGPFAAPVAGAAFGLGWSPCIGPILGAVLAVSASEGQTVRGGAWSRTRWGSACPSSLSD
jgi:cytochrome c-type biogenesis protein